MPHRLEVALKSDLFDAEGEGIRRKAHDYFGIHLVQVRTIHVLTIDADLSDSQLRILRKEIFTNPVTQISSFNPLPIEFDWTIWVGFRPGVRDNPGSTAVEAVEDLLDIRFAKNEAIYTSRRYCLQGPELTAADAEKIAAELLANNIIQQWKLYPKEKWNPRRRRRKDPFAGSGGIAPGYRRTETFSPAGCCRGNWGICARIPTVNCG